MKRKKKSKNTKTKSKAFCHKKTQSESGSYYANKQNLVIIARYLNVNIFTQIYILKTLCFVYGQKNYILKKLMIEKKNLFFFSSFVYLANEK